MYQPIIYSRKQGYERRKIEPNLGKERYIKNQRRTTRQIKKDSVVEEVSTSIEEMLRGRRIERKHVLSVYTIQYQTRNCT
jgi:hypothetical protein